MTVALSGDLHRGPDTHSNRPSATAVGAGTVYVCTTHNLIYRSNGSAWSTYATLILPGGTTGQALVKGSNTDYDVAWGTVSGGGGTTVKDARWNVLSGQTSYDEFNDASLDAAWTRVDGTGAVSGNLAWTENADSLSALNAGADSSNAMHAMVRPLSGLGGSLSNGDAFITHVDLFGPISAEQITGLIIADGNTFGSGNEVMAMFRQNATVGMILDGRTVTSYGAVGSSVGPITIGPRSVHIRLALISANTWRADVSSDGVSWTKGTATVSSSITPSHVGFVSSSFGTSVKHTVSYEYLRRVAGVT